MHNPLSRKINFGSLIKFTGPTITMMVVMAFYTMVDGIFVSRLIGTTALSAVNIVYPVLNLTVAIGIMLATGGSAIVGRQMGEKRNDLARENFSMLVYLGIIIGVVMAVLGTMFLDQIITFLGANDAVFAYCKSYAFILILFMPIEILQMLFQFFFVTAGKPHVGLIVTTIGGVVNIVLDYVFIAELGMGIAGAALATGLGFSVPALYGLFYFGVKRKAILHFVKAKFDGAVILKACQNGSSEMVTNLAIAVTTLLFNITMMKYVGEDGVAAVTIILYAEYLLNAVFLGYSSGVAPLFSYNYGGQNISSLKKLFRYSGRVVIGGSISIFILANILCTTIVTVFTPEGTAVYDLAVQGLRMFSFAFLLMGSNIFSSAMFTALSNGKISAMISLLRTFVLLSLFIILLPMIMGITGIWLAVPFAEALAIIFSIACIVKQRKRYQYC